MGKADGSEKEKYYRSDLSHLDRKVKKPLMEKKRRKRINDSLNELKNILLEIMRKDPSQTPKLEKADILEFTVQHLRNTNASSNGNGHHQIFGPIESRRRNFEHFLIGWSECADHVIQYFKSKAVDHKFVTHLFCHLNSMKPRVDETHPVCSFGILPIANALTCNISRPSTNQISFRPPLLPTVAPPVVPTVLNKSKIRPQQLPCVQNNGTHLMNIENFVQKTVGSGSTSCEKVKNGTGSNPMESGSVEKPWRPW